MEIASILKRSLVLLLSTLVCGALSAGESVEIRTKEGIDFSVYETYAWASHQHESADSPTREGAPLDLEIRRAADKRLQSRGFALVERGDSPDLMINYVGIGKDHFDAAGVTKEVAPGVKWIGDPNAHSMRSYRQGTLVFEVVDTETNEMVWSGWVTELAPSIEKLRAKADKATRKVFRHFPSR